MNKKGISPLIGTVLLVAIVIAMILLIMPWITETIRSQQEKTTEASRKFDCITNLNFELTGSPDNIMIDNRGDVKIESIKFRKYIADGGLETNGVYDFDNPVGGIAQGIAPYEIVESTLCTVDAVTGAKITDKIEAMATIMSGGKPLVCADAPREYYC